MRTGLLVLVLCAATSASAEPAVEPTPTQATAFSVEVAGTWSGYTVEPKMGWRAAVLVPIAQPSSGPRRLDSSVAFIGRFDDHGAPAESGDAETHATSLGAGLRVTRTWGSSHARVGVFAEGTVGVTRARHDDAMTSQRDVHGMLSGGLVAGTRSVQIVGDFGWMVTKAGDGRIGPIASVGLHFVLD